jgi:hypothetical protein
MAKRRNPPATTDLLTHCFGRDLRRAKKENVRSYEVHGMILRESGISYHKGVCIPRLAHSRALSDLGVVKPIDSDPRFTKRLETSLSSRGARRVLIHIGENKDGKDCYTHFPYGLIAYPYTDFAPVKISDLSNTNPRQQVEEHIGRVSTFLACTSKEDLTLALKSTKWWLAMSNATKKRGKAKFDTEEDPVDIYGKEVVDSVKKVVEFAGKDDLEAIKSVSRDIAFLIDRTARRITRGVRKISPDAFRSSLIEFINQDTERIPTQWTIGQIDLRVTRKYAKLLPR